MKLGSSTDRRAALSLFEQYLERRRRRNQKALLHGGGVIGLPPIEGFSGELVAVRIPAKLLRLDDDEWELCSCCDHSEPLDDGMMPTRLMGK